MDGHVDDRYDGDDGGGYGSEENWGDFIRQVGIDKEASLRP